MAFDFTVKPQNAPMAGISLADLIAAKKSPITEALQGLAPVLQALQQQKQAQQKQQLIAQAAGNDPQKMALLGLGITPPEFKKTRTLLSPETSQFLADQLKVPLPDSGQFYEDEVPALKSAKAPAAKSGDLTPDQKGNLAWGLQNKLIAPNQMTYRGPKAEILSNYLGEMRAGSKPKQSLIDLDAYSKAEASRATGQAGVQGKEGQLIGSAAGSMEDMVSKAKPLMDRVSPTQFRMINSALQAGLNQINDPSLLKVYTYLTSAAGFYASLQKNGGVPDQQERAAAMKVISSLLNQGGMAAVESALHDEANSRVKRIKGAGFEEKNPMGGGGKAGDPLGIL